MYFIILFDTNLRYVLQGRAGQRCVNRRKVAFLIESDVA